VRSWELGVLLHYSMRYAFGRITHAVDDVTRLIRENWDDITDNDRSQIRQDLERDLQREMDNYAPRRTDWIALRDWISARCITSHQDPG
jgi:hypothetical protein